MFCLWPQVESDAGYEDYEEALQDKERVQGLIEELHTGNTSTATLKALPVMAHRQAIVEAIRTHNLVLIEGDTGCGKSTQIPQFIADAFGGASVVITQPTRIAVVGTAKRVAKERDSTLGYEVSWP